MTIVLASRNEGKIKEIGFMLADLQVTVKSLRDYPDCPEIQEDGCTFYENALKKGLTVARYTREWVLADDSGLEVDALGGAPGVLSARFAGEGAKDEDNNRKLLEALRGVPFDKRGATFRCILVFIHPNGEHKTFEGRWRGVIAEEPRGNGGFGYDPLFYIPELGLTAAELPLEKKNRLSHRAQAVKQFKKYLQSFLKTNS
ncbi:MAG: XTP/dITP diphosphatase [Syntrophales bacterium]|nr:XTP/dITP diphosphatase [Syntrophales bacterium]